VNTHHCRSNESVDQFSEAGTLPFPFPFFLFEIYHEKDRNEDFKNKK